MLLASALGAAGFIWWITALIAMVFLLPGGIVGGLRKLADRIIPATPIAQTPEPSKETS